MEDINTINLAMAHIIIHNPIIRDTDDNKKEYLRRLNSYIKIGGWYRRKFESAQLQAYERIISESNETGEHHEMSFYKYYILFDMMHVLAYNYKPTGMDKVVIFKEKYNKDFGEFSNKKTVNGILETFRNGAKNVKRLLSEPELFEEREYIRLITDNIAFKKKEPVRVMVTATMSAGKSTFINALIGKYICLSQSMACTSKIHCIVNKAFEDGFSAEYDHELVLIAGKEELLNDNERNSSDKIVVSTNFKGMMCDQRIIVNDSPGVNYSGNQSHKLIADRLVKGKQYDLLIYVMNVTQLATNDESEHLDYVRKAIGRKPVIFVINKMDTFNVEEEDIEATIRRQMDFLRKKGFKDPVICPVSSRAGYLAKKYASSQLTKLEKRELYNYIDKFEQMNLSEYYAKAFKKITVADADHEEEQLLKTCGLAYIEKIIITLTKGGNVNGSGIR